ncbi:sugar-binding domain-containing protein [Paenibacillus eucommiae]|uniref:Beta-galactosidase n=1 Tax=Paenibacillus eucommiae TaxID=1355755 RepID=A0ABS4J361_9BACL|nr:sugar-binding domain-containing protein [Paenibacillus eucommiae]MBP1993676.1 hypothetical protein [Paenibacillus eucommiae]
MLDREQFAAGFDEYRPVMMWFWNDEMDEAEIRKQIEGFHAQRIYQFYIHPQSTLQVEYLSERYFELIGVAIEHAKLLGMKFWIYDEYNWPSGMVGGKLLRDYPEYRMLVVRHKQAWINQGQTDTIAYSGRLLQAQAMYGGSGAVRDVIHEGIWDETAGTFTWTNRDTSMAELHLFSEEKQGGVFAASMLTPYSWYQEGYLDTMNPEAVRKFLDMTHEQYAARFGEHFGHTVAGVFTDEVNLANPFDFGPGTIPWTKDFDRVFYEANGYALLPQLASLVIDTGDYRRIRYDFWRTLTERFAEAYAVQVAAWCEEHNVLLTGHVSGEENLIADLLQTGNAFTFLQHFHIPAIDSIFSKQRIVNEDFNLAGKLIVSIAEHIEAPRTLCETYTGSGWDLTMEEMKQILNRLAVLGVNTIQFMGAYYSLRGLRKRMPITYPTTHNFQIPAWPYYGLFSDYTSRLCFANSFGTHQADIAVLMPTASVFSEYALRHEFWDCVKPYEDRPYGDLDITESTLQGVNNALLQIQREFDLLHEPSFLEAEVGAGGTLLFRGHAYKQLIVPSLLVLTGALSDKLSQFATAGGHVCFVNLLPFASPDQGDITEELEGITGFAPYKVADEVRSCFGKRADTKTAVYQSGAISRIVSNELKQTENAGLRDALQQCLSWNEPLLSLKEACSHIFVCHRHEVAADKRAGTDLFLLVNDEQTVYDGGLRIGRDGVVIAHDPETGRSHVPKQWTDENERLEVQLSFAGGQAWIIEVNDEIGQTSDLADKALLTSSSVQEGMDLSGEWEFAAPGDYNLMRLAIDVAVVDESVSIEAVAKSLENSMEKSLENSLTNSLLNERKWLSASDFYFPAGVGFSLGAMYEARAAFKVKQVPHNLELVIDPEEEQQVWVNGVRIEPDRTEHVWDRTNLIFEIQQWVKQGENEIVLRERIPNYGAQHMPAFMALRGSFGVDASRSLVAMPSRLSVPGSWTDQGLPDYSGSGIYKRIVTMDSDNSMAPCSIELVAEDSRDIMELWCNGDYVGTSLWKPHQFDLTGFMKGGNNELELRVSNTMANFMENPLVSSGLTGKVKLHFRD